MASFVPSTQIALNCCFNEELFPKINSSTTPDQLDTMYRTFQQHSRGNASFFSTVNADDETVLHQATRTGNIVLMRRIVHLDSDRQSLGAGNKLGFTALHTAVAYNQEQAAETLLELGAPVNRGSLIPIMYQSIIIPPSTSLWYAARLTRHLGMCKILLKWGAVAFPEMEVDDTGKEVLKTAQKELINEKATLTSVLKDHIKMPDVLIRIVQDCLYYRLQKDEIAQLT